MLTLPHTNDNLEAMAKQLYDYWFVQFDFPDENGMPYKSSGGKMVWNNKLQRDVPEGWKEVSLKELVSTQRSMIKPQKDVLYQHFSIPSFDANGSYELNYGSEIHSEKFSVAEGQLLVSKLNPWFNRVLWIPQGKNMISSTEFVVMSPKLQSNTGYLYSIIKSERFVDYCSRSAIGTSHSQRRVSPDVMLSFQLPYDPNISRQFSQFMSYISLKQECIKTLSRCLSKQRDELLPLLMNGQVSVNYHLCELKCTGNILLLIFLYICESEVKILTMKKSILNLGAIAIAFCLGISIHNSCADPDNYNTTRGDASSEELWAAIDALKEEINALKSKVQTLENSAGTGTVSDCGEFCVDGLWFDRSGFCCSPISYSTLSANDASSSKTEYKYDSKGRYIGYVQDNLTVDIIYEGKVQLLTSKYIDPSSGLVGTTIQKYEYK